MFLASARQLAANVPVWHLQRRPNAARVAAITATLRARAPTPWLPGVITCFHMPGRGRRASIGTAQTAGVVDGQHRLLACKALFAEAGASPDGDHLLDVPLLVHVHAVAGDAGVKALFLELNKAESVPEVDLPDALAPPAKVAIDAAVGALADAFPGMFKPSARCRPPHVHGDSLRNALHRSGVVAALGTPSPARLKALLLAASARLGQRPAEVWPAKLRGRPLAKARAAGLWLGLDMHGAVALLPEL